jgi:CDP-diacylglycerol--glycerol-3-phosphate 3-phosphatidyltransferase
MRKNTDSAWLNVPNALTFFRILLVPLFIALVVLSENARTAFSHINSVGIVPFSGNRVTFESIVATLSGSDSGAGAAVGVGAGAGSAVGAEAGFSLQNGYVHFRLLALIVFIVAMITDQLDGFIARRYHLITKLGKLLDPIADKVLLGSGIIIFSVYGYINPIFPILIIFREVFITVYRILIINKKGIVISASILGKIKTNLQAIAVGLYVLPLSVIPNFFGIVAFVVLLLATAITLGSGIQYIAARPKVAGEKVS